MTTEASRRERAGEEWRPSEAQLRIARQIIDYVHRHALRVGDPLREQTLADVFSASRSPIRGALRYLTERGVLEQRPNRGFFLRQQPSDMQIENWPTHPSEDEAIYRQISRDWFEGRLPRHVTEVELRRRYDLGRSTLNRALQNLAEDGVISRNTAQGWQFESTLNEESAHDESYQFRQMIEPAAILMPTFRLDRTLADLSRRRHKTILEGGRQGTSISALVEVDVDFHGFIARSSRNRFVEQAIERQNALRRLVEYETLLETGRLLISCIEHMQILDAIEQGNLMGAAELMRQHLDIASRYKPHFVQTAQE